jgi:hypothetical protein
MASQKRSRRSVIEPVFIISAARMNIGIASRIQLWYIPFSSCSATVPRSCPTRIR